MTNQEVTTIKLMPVNDIMIMAKTFAESGMFTDAKQMGQAFVKIQAGQEIGIPPFAAMSGIHIIQGKPTIGAGLIASTVKGSGKYDYKVVKLDDTICSLDFYQGATNIGNSTFTIQDAKKALTKNIDKFPKNMLFARAISNGVKWFCPDVFSGPVYTPEEMESVTTTEDVAHVEVKVKLPNLTDKMFNQLCTKVIAGDQTSIDKAKSMFTLNQEQEDTLQSLLINEEAVNV
jgi:hypothetical protein